MSIHSTAIVDPRAELDSSVEVGPYTIVGPEVRVGPDTRIGAHATLEGPTTIGRGNRIFNYAVIGTDSQDMKFAGARSYLEIGDENIIREFVSINRATEEGTTTRVGSHNRILAYVHIAHNCTVGDHVIMSNVASLAGHVQIHDNAILGGLVAVHQFCRIGSYALIGAGAKVVKDIPPYCLADGVPARLAGVNSIGLQRHGFPSDQILRIRRTYMELFRKSRNLGQRAEELRRRGAREPHERLLLDFISASRRGIARIR